VVFLMFSIGLEFSLPKLSAMRHIVFGLGMAQVATTICHHGDRWARPWCCRSSST
jgi:Kef-type K+ transport system membrane component KefB